MDLRSASTTSAIRAFAKRARTVTFAAVVAVISPGMAQAVEPDPLFYNRGLTIYANNCSSCHGINGDGNGPNAAQQAAPPRNFLIGNFKFRTTGPGENPSLEDIAQVLFSGIEGPEGQIMPAFKDMPLMDRFAVIEVVRVMAEIPEFGTPVAIPPRPAQSVPGLGQQLYSDMGCIDCHGAKGDGAGSLAASLEDADGNPIVPADFTQGKFKGGSFDDDIWMRIYSGVDGTPMPSFGLNLDANQIWALVDYVQEFQAR